MTEYCDACGHSVGGHGGPESLGQCRTCECPVYTVTIPAVPQRLALGSFPLRKAA